uniref:Uncharacterized protein n=1 Tax=Ananas comosus var. bracteatus TaxID=296719 RepID=A0A6V7PB23_ANACO|nr:unnamed protein product [Ananas comosus var. bracteatus]
MIIPFLSSEVVHPHASSQEKVRGCEQWPRQWQHGAPAVEGWTRRRWMRGTGEGLRVRRKDEGLLLVIWLNPAGLASYTLYKYGSITTDLESYRCGVPGTAH